MCNICETKTKKDFTIYGNEFTSSIEYGNKLLHGRYRLYMRGLGFLIKETEWGKLPDGGFKILIPGWAVTTDVIINVQFY